MNMVLRGKKKNFSFKRLRKSVNYSFDGIKFLLSNEQNLLIMFVTSILVITAGFILKVNFVEWVTLIIMMGMIISLELVNTAIEYTVDIAMPEKHPYAKIAKDCASGALFIMCLASVIIGLIVFLPKIISILK